MIKQHLEYIKYSTNELGQLFGPRGLISPIVGKSGYVVYSIYLGGGRSFPKRKNIKIHRFVWECHNGSIPEGLQINHKDGDKTNNALSNLELMTPSENIQHAYRLDLKNGKSKQGIKHHNNKHSEDTIKQVIHELILGASNTTLETKYDIPNKLISLIRHKKRWKHLFLLPEFSDYIPMRSKNSNDHP